MYYILKFMEDWSIFWDDKNLLAFVVVFVLFFIIAMIREKIGRGRYNVNGN